MGGCNPCAAQYNPRNNHLADGGKTFNQFYGLRDFDIYVKGQYILETESNDLGDMEDSNSDENDNLAIKLKLSDQDYLTKSIKEKLESDYFKYKKDAHGNKSYKKNKEIDQFLDDFAEAIYYDLQESLPDDLNDQVGLNKLFQYRKPYIKRNFIKTAMKYDENKYGSRKDEVKPWQKILDYCRMVKPDFELKEKPLNKCEVEIVSKFLRVLFLTQQNGKYFVEERQFQIFTDHLSVKVSKQLINFCEDEWKYLGEGCMKKHALLKELRQTSYQDSCAEYIVLFHNILSDFKKEFEKQKKELGEDKVEHYFKTSEFKRDLQWYKDSKEMINQMALTYHQFVVSDKYYHYEDCEENEMVQLMKVNDRGLFRNVLEKVFIDAEDSKAETIYDQSHKLRCLAVGIFYGGFQQKSEDDVPFILPEDVNICCNLIRMRIDELQTLALEQSQYRDQIHKTLASINMVLYYMSVCLYKGFSEKSYQQLRECLLDFLGSYADRAIATISRQIKVNNSCDRSFMDELIANIVEASSLDEQAEMTDKMGYTAQALFALQAVDRIRKNFTSNLKQSFDFFNEGRLGVASIFQGIMNLEYDQIVQGTEDLGRFAFAQYQKSPKDWYDNIIYMQQLGETDFEQFEKIFFSGDLKNEIIRQNMKSDLEGKVIVTYFTIKQLDNIVRNRQRSHNNRMRAITLMRYIYENKNYENKKKLSYEMFPNMQFYIKRCLTDFQKLKNKDEKVRALEQEDRIHEMVRYAKEVLLSLHCDSKEADDYVKSLIHEYGPNKLGTEQHFFYTDFFTQSRKDRDGFRDRKVYKYCLQREMKYQCLLSRMYKGCNDRYLDSKLNVEIELFVEKFIDAKEVDQPPRQFLKNVLPSFMNSNRRSIIVSGNKGSGKSQLMRKLEYKQWRRFQKGTCNYIPICIRLKDINNPSKCIEEFIDKINEVDESGYDSAEKKDKKLRRFKKDLLVNNSNNEENDHEFLIILDQYDELPQVRNILEINKFDDQWSPKTKFIICKNHQENNLMSKQMLKFREDDDPIKEFRIADITQQQIEHFFVESQKLNKAKHNTEELQIQREQIINKERMPQIQTVRTVNLVFDSLPIKNNYQQFLQDNLLLISKCQELQDFASIFQNVSQKEFQTNQNKILEDQNLEIPRGFDLATSFHNYSCSLAVDMWQYKKRSVKVRQNFYPFPTAKELKTQDIDNYFMKYFCLKDPHVKLAREGATQIYEYNSQVGFINEQTQFYFIACSLFKYLKDYNKNKAKIPLQKSYLNCHVFQNEIGEFVIGMILNDISQFEEQSIKDSIFAGDDKDIKQEGIEDKKSMKNKAVKRKNLSPIEDNLIEILKTATKKNVKDTGMQNVINICSCLVHLIQEIPDDVHEYILNEAEDFPALSKSRLLYGKALSAREKGNLDECQELQLKALGYDLNGVYKGEIRPVNPELSRIKIQAHGEGKLDYSNGDKYQGQFENNMRHGKGFMEFAKSDMDEKIAKFKYSGEFFNDVIHGQGVLEYADGGRYEGNFFKGLRQGQGSQYYQGIDHEYHGSWQRDLRHGPGIFVSRQEGNEFVLNCTLNNGMIDQKVWVIFGAQKHYTNMIFKGTYKNGVCQNGQMFISDQKAFDGRLSLKNTLEFYFYQDKDIVSDYDKAVVFYQNSFADEPVIERKDFDRMMYAKQFYYKVLDDQKILIYKNKIVLSSMPQEQEVLVKRAQNDRVIKKPKSDHDSNNTYKFDHVSEFPSKNWDEAFIKQKIVKVDGHVVSDKIL